MATETRRAKRQHAGIAILDQLADLDVRSISPETAQTLLKLRFDEFHHERFNLLTAKAREASLTPSEQADLDEYIQTGGYPGDRAVQSPPGPQERWRGCSVTVLSHVQVDHRRFNNCETRVRHIFARSAFRSGSGGAAPPSPPHSPPLQAPLCLFSFLP